MSTPRKSPSAVLHIDDCIFLRSFLPPDQQRRYDVVHAHLKEWTKMLATTTGHSSKVIQDYILDGILPDIVWKLQFFEPINKWTGTRDACVRISSDFGAFGFDFANLTDEELEQIRANVEFLTGKYELINKLYFSNEENTNFFIALKDTDIQSQNKILAAKL